MQAIKTVTLREAEDTSRRIREQTAWFYLRHMNIDEDTSPSTAFHALLTRKERETLPAPQGEKEKAVRSPLCTRSTLLEAQLYDTINAYTKLFIMNDAGIPADLRKKLNTELEQFNSQITQTLMDKSTDCVRRNTSAERMAEELLAVFNKAAIGSLQNLPRAVKGKKAQKKEKHDFREKGIAKQASTLRRPRNKEITINL